MLYNDPAIAFEFVFNDDIEIKDLAVSLNDLFSHEFDLFPAFTGSKKFYFLIIPEVHRPFYQSGNAYEQAQILIDRIGAAEIDPVFQDSIYGSGYFSDAEDLSDGCSTAFDDTLSKGWHHTVVKTASGWQSNKGKGGLVAVIDTGKSDHKELNDVFTDTGVDLIDNDNVPDDTFEDGRFDQPGHGTLVASVIGSRGGLSSSSLPTPPGVLTGVAPEAKLIPIRAITSVIRTNFLLYPAAIQHAIDNDADVIIIAAGGIGQGRNATQAKLKEAVEAGILVICAAGNCVPNVVFPAKLSRQNLCTAVAAVDQNLEPWEKTSKGPLVTLSAPGENVWGAVKRSKVSSNTLVKPTQGTTLASSIVAGAALLWSNDLGGRDGLKKRAQQEETTGQVLFNRTLKQVLQPPPVWEGRKDLGAGVLDISKMFNPVQRSFVAEKSTPAGESFPTAAWGGYSSAVLAKSIFLDYLPGATFVDSDEFPVVASELIRRLDLVSAKRRFSSSTNTTRLYEDMPALSAKAATMADSYPELRALLELD